MEAWERIEAVMNYFGLNKNSFSKELGFSNNGTIGRIINEKRTPSSATLRKITERFKMVNYDWLVTGIGEMIIDNVDFIDAKHMSDIQFLNIPFVPIHAQAGYGKGYGDQEYIGSLPTIPVIVDKNYRGKYRVFEVEGDSMDDGTRNSICSGDKILCREVKPDLWFNKLHIKDWYFVICMKNNGILVKQIIDHDVESGRIVCHSLNPLFENFEVNLSEVGELYNVIKIVDRNTRI